MSRMLCTVASTVVLATVQLPAQATGSATRTTIQTQSGSLTVERLATLDNPWGMAYLPGGRLLITEKPGRLRILERGKLSAPIEGVPAVAYRAQGGLLDVAVDPDFARNGFVYLSYAELAAQQPPAGTHDTVEPRFAAYNDTLDGQLKGGAVARGRLDGMQLRDVRVIWRQTPKTIGRGHFGGRLLFGRDGKLFITSGDRMRFDPAQDLASNIGKIVRINPDGTIPADNPFVGREGVLGDIWSVGSRNALGAAINPVSGQLWINEMGPAGGDEVNIITAGRNYGWPRVSNGDNYDGSQVPDHVADKQYDASVASWNPSVSPSGMLFYSGRRFAQWRGNVLMGGLSSKALIRLTIQEGRVSGIEMIDMNKRIRDVIEASDGAVLLLTDGPDAELLRLTPRARGRT